MFVFCNMVKCYMLMLCVCKNVLLTFEKKRALVWPWSTLAASVPRALCPFSRIPRRPGHRRADMPEWLPYSTDSFGAEKKKKERELRKSENGHNRWVGVWVCG